MYNLLSSPSYVFPCKYRTILQTFFPLLPRWKSFPTGSSEVMNTTRANTEIPNIKRHVIFVFNYKYCRRDETSPADKIVDRYRLNDDVRLIIDLSSRDSTSNSSNLSSTISPRRRPCPWLFATVSGFIGTHNFGQDSGHSWWSRWLDGNIYQRGDGG